MSEIFNEYFRFYKKYPIYGIVANLLLGGFMVNIVSGYLPSILNVPRLLTYITIALIFCFILNGSHFLYLKSKTIDMSKACVSPKTKYKGLIVSISPIKDKGDLINRINSARDSIKCTFRTLALLYHYAILKGHFVDIRLIKCPIVKYYCPILAGVRNVQ